MGGIPKGLLQVGGLRILDRLVAAFLEGLGSLPLLVANAPEAGSWRDDTVFSAVLSLALLAENGRRRILLLEGVQQASQRSRRPRLEGALAPTHEDRIAKGDGERFSFRPLLAVKQSVAQSAHIALNGVMAGDAPLAAVLKVRADYFHLG